ncbi:MAG: HD domain-containing phosphohydrolase [Betaproteobacteria bacterium]
MPRRVLLVDDTEINLMVLSALVNRLGDAQCHSFSEPTHALDFARLTRVDLVVVDYMMPGMDGIAFIDAFRSIDGAASIPVLMVTANDEKEVLYRALNSGADDFLPRPVDALEFLARARNMLKLSDANRRLADHAAWLTDAVRQATQEVRIRERETVIALAKAAAYRDVETGEHILRVAHYAHLIAREIALPEADQELLLEASSMHDIGKVGIPDHILCKQGRLDESELAVMHRHATLGYELLRGSSSELLQAAAQIALGHHEKYDGSGYPQALAGEAIPLFCRIVAVADVFDALTTERPYKTAWSMDRAKDHLLAGRGVHFEPRLVDAFVAAWTEVIEIHERFQDPS